jgi:hypothetical protein
MSHAVAEITGVTPTSSGTRRAFCDVHIPPVKIHRVQVHHDGDRKWVVFPSAPKLDANQEVVRNKNGRVVQVPIITLPDPELKAQIFEWIISRVDEILGRYADDLAAQEKFKNTEIRLS